MPEEVKAAQVGLYINRSCRIPRTMLTRAVVTPVAALCILAADVATARQNLIAAGRVTDSAGSPIEGVRVMSLPHVDTKTNIRGEFRVADANEVVRFSKRGYAPVTKAIDDIGSTVVLLPMRESNWRPSTCSPGMAKRFGHIMQFTVSPKLHLDHVADVDYETFSVRRGRALLTYGAGTHWTSGLPRRSQLSGLRSFTERDIETPWDDPLAEYRGVRENGTRWREILMFGESIEYDDAPENVANEFDVIIDSLCFRPKT